MKDLVGKKVAVNPAAHGEYILLKALEEAGVPFDQVERVPIQPPDAAAAFASGAVDAWSTFGNFFTGALANGATLLTYESDLDSDDVGVIAASAAQIEKNPAAFKVIVDVYNQLVEESHTEPEKFQNIFTAVRSDGRLRRRARAADRGHEAHAAVGARDPERHRSGAGRARHLRRRPACLQKTRAGRRRRVRHRRRAGAK